MDIRPREVRYYITADGKAVVPEWLDTIGDLRVLARIQVRLDRLKIGHFGDVKSVGGGVMELRLDVGPGFRIYYALDGATVVLLLCAGVKRSQARDLRRAREYREDYMKRKRIYDDKAHG